MASKVNKKLSVEEFYAGRVEVQELVDNGVIPQSEPSVTAVRPTPVLAPKAIGVSALREQPLPNYISLTKLARTHYMDTPSYVI